MSHRRSGGAQTRRRPLHFVTYPEALASMRAAVGVTGTVLVVDDDPSVCRLVSRVLETRFPELRVKFETSGASALAALGREWPDVLVLDVYLPDVEGETVAAFLRRREEAERPVHLIAMSGADAEETRERTRAWTPELFLSKPIDTRALVEHVEAILGAPDDE